MIGSGAIFAVVRRLHDWIEVYDRLVQTLMMDTFGLERYAGKPTDCLMEGGDCSSGTV